MIKLSNGYELEFVASSGALGFDGKGYWWEQPLKLIGLFDTDLFTPVTKTLTYHPRRGNYRWWKPWKTVRFVKDGVINSVGLSNAGIYEWIDKNVKYDGIVSIYPEGDYISTHMINVLIHRIKGLRAIELNISCPNDSTDNVCKFNEHALEDLLEKLNDDLPDKIPLILKLNPEQNITFTSTMNKFIEAISINSVPVSTGALSGKAAQLFTWTFIKQLKKKTNIPIIGCSVWDYDDIQKLYKIGCSAIGFGSVFLRFPWRPTQFVRRYKEQILENTVMI